MFFGTLWSSIKQVKAPYVFDVEHGIVLHAMQSSWPHLTAKGKPHGFSPVAAGTWGIFSSYGGCPFKTQVCSVTSGLLLSYEGHLKISSRLGRAIRTLLLVRRETQCPFPVAKGILGFLSILKKSHASSPFVALNSTCLLKCQMDVRPPL